MPKPPLKLDELFEKIEATLSARLDEAGFVQHSGDKGENREQVLMEQGAKNGKSGYGGSAIGNKGRADAGTYAGYRPLVVDIVKFFRTGKVPVSEAETLEIYAFMEAADESKRQNGKSVTLEYVMKKARAAAKKRLTELDK